MRRITQGVTVISDGTGLSSVTHMMPGTVKKSTITVDEAQAAMAESYRRMAADEAHEKAAEAWVAALEGET